MDKEAFDIVSKLNNAGFEAFFVGGCVRDSLLGRQLNDIDITTSALTDDVMRIFGSNHVEPTGIKHGTVTVFGHYEVTTFRIDGNYSDSRHPESVTFTTDLNQDLARRDFTMNAIAMDKNSAFQDPFNGISDVNAHIIRCVGDPEKRFTEDALRIIRAVRFAAQLGFTIEEKTAAAIHSHCKLLNSISPDRVRNELDKLICGEFCVPVMLEYSDVITAIIPEFSDCIGFDQRSPYHKYTVWEHIVRAVGAAPADDIFLRRSLFFHDIGKPPCAKFDENGRGHFKGHDAIGAQITKNVMKRLHYDNQTINLTTALISNHSTKINSPASIKHLMSIIGDDMTFKLIEMKKCDNSAKNDFVLDAVQKLDLMLEIAQNIVNDNECRNLHGLAVKGSDIAQLNLNGSEIGSALQMLLSKVIEGELPNDKNALIAYLRRNIHD